jgi:dethiobiotin synthetase
MLRLGITGTDTGVGKTVIARATVAWLRNRRLKVAAMKPIETGEQLIDAKLLREAAGSIDSLENVCPVHFREPVAPFTAAYHSGTTVNLSLLDHAYSRLSSGRNVMVVEGAGGLLVPITRDVSFATLFKRWNLTLLIVAANRLGVLNHTLLTLRVARLLGINIGGIILNHLPVKSPDASVDSNLEVLSQLLPDVPLIAFPSAEEPLDLSRLCDVAESSGLGALLESEIHKRHPRRRALTESNSHRFPQ